MEGLMEPSSSGSQEGVGKADHDSLFMLHELRNPSLVMRLFWSPLARFCYKYVAQFVEYCGLKLLGTIATKLFEIGRNGGAFVLPERMCPRCPLPVIVTIELKGDFPVAQSQNWCPGLNDPPDGCFSFGHGDVISPETRCAEPRTP